MGFLYALLLLSGRSEWTSRVVSRCVTAGSSATVGVGHDSSVCTPATGGSRPPHNPANFPSCITYAATIEQDWAGLCVLATPRRRCPRGPSFWLFLEVEDMLAHRDFADQNDFLQFMCARFRYCKSLGDGGVDLSSWGLVV